MKKLVFLILLTLILSGCAEAGIPYTPVEPPTVTVTVTPTPTPTTPPTTVTITVTPTPTVKPTLNPTTPAPKPTTFIPTMTPTPTPNPEIGLKQGPLVRYTDTGATLTRYYIPVRIANNSDYGVDVTWNTKVIDSTGLTLEDRDVTIKDIWPNETYLAQAGINADPNSKISITIKRAGKTTDPPISKRTDLTILDAMPILGNKNFDVKIKNNTDTLLYPKLKVRLYYTTGELYSTRGKMIESDQAISPYESRLIHLFGFFGISILGGTENGNRFVYLID